jgi:hypothetical protein
MGTSLALGDYRGFGPGRRAPGRAARAIPATLVVPDQQFSRTTRGSREGVHRRDEAARLPGGLAPARTPRCTTGLDASRDPPRIRRNEAAVQKDVQRANLRVGLDAKTHRSWKHWPESGLSRPPIAQRHPRYSGMGINRGDRGRLTGHSTSGSGTALWSR